MDDSRSPRRTSPANELPTLLLLLLSSLGWFALVLASLAGVVITSWLTLALARAARADASGSLGPLALALVVSIGIPVALAFWRHQRDLRRVTTTLAWLPAAWNACGLLLASQLIPDVMGTALRSNGAWVAVEQLGDTHTGTRVLSALGHNTADWIDPPPDAPPIKPDAEVEASLSLGDEGLEAITVPFSSEGNAILMDVEVSGPNATITKPYLFDTGASFTTINTNTAREIGITVPEDAPTLKFNTASGPREGQMVYLPRIKLRDVEIEGLLVSVCDGCVNERSAGLLGLNVMREFVVTIDFPEHIQLVPRPRQARPNRAYDINPTVEFEVERPEIWLGRVRWIVQVQNRGTVPIFDVVPEVRFSDGQRLRGAAVPEIAPGAIGESLVEGRATTEDRDTELGFVISLVEAYW